MIRRLLVLLTVLAGLALALPAVADAAVACPPIGGSLPRGDAVGTTPTPITGVRAGRNTCFDRVVIDINGPVATGYSIAYTSQVTAEGSGLPVPTPGGARMQLTVRHPAGSLRMPSVAGFTTLRSVTFGGSFEGYTTFGIGTRARLPFRVFTLTSPARLVVDVYNHW